MKSHSLSVDIQWHDSILIKKLNEIRLYLVHVKDATLARFCYR